MFCSEQGNKSWNYSNVTEQVGTRCPVAKTRITLWEGGPHSDSIRTGITAGMRRIRSSYI